MSFFAGADVRAIQPDLSKPAFLAGYSRNRRATGTHDPLLVRTVALGEGHTILVLAVCDLIGLARIDTLDIRRQINAPATTHIVIACTHTHSGVDTIGLWGSDEQTTGCDAAYIEWAKAQVIDSCKAAISSMQPAQLRVAMGEVRGIVRNFRDPDIVDHELGVLQAVGEGGVPLFTLLNFPCHPEVLANDNTLITADMAGFACCAIERDIGGVGVWASGHLGGMMSPDTDTHDFETCRRFGEKLASAAIEMIRIGNFWDVNRLYFVSKEVHIPMRNPLLSLASSIGLLRAGPQTDVVTTEVAVWDLGPAGQVAFVPGELLPALGMHLKTKMRGRGKFVVGLANDEIGYILPDEAYTTPADFLNPGPQYEESMSLGANTGSLITTALEDLLQQSPGNCA
jgi:hypothetical protein